MRLKSFEDWNVLRDKGHAVNDGSVVPLCESISCLEPSNGRHVYGKIAVLPVASFIRRFATMMRMVGDLTPPNRIRCLQGRTCTATYYTCTIAISSTCSEASLSQLDQGNEIGALQTSRCPPMDLHLRRVARLQILKVEPAGIHSQGIIQIKFVFSILACNGLTSVYTPEPQSLSFLTAYCTTPYNIAFRPDLLKTRLRGKHTRTLAHVI